MRYLAFLLLFCSSALCQELKIVGDTKVIDIDRTVVVKDKITLVNTLPVTVSAPAGGFGYAWDYPTGITAKRTLNTLVISAAPKGITSISVEWSVVDFDKKLIDGKSASITFAIGAPDPVPPKPPEPATKPIAIEGISVLMVVNKDATGVIGTQGQKSFVTSADIRVYLDSKCSKDPASQEWKAYRQLQATTDMSGDAKAWQDAMKRPRNTTAPWMIISNPKGSYEGPIPATYDEAFALLKKYVEQ